MLFLLDKKQNTSQSFGNCHESIIFKCAHCLREVLTRWKSVVCVGAASADRHLKFSAGVADLIDVGQRASVVLRPGLRQAKLLDLLELHLSVKNKGQKNNG